jgi:deazaflavin-dependent oxidoreductase (nitroreductase family)
MLFGKEHVERYRATGGGEGHDWQGTTTLLLTTTGRHSGERRTAPLIYQRFGDGYLVVASDGGSDTHPGWYLNLETDRQVEVQVKNDRFAARARDATGDEKPEMWRTMTAAWPPYDDYQKRTERPIPVVVLERA